MYKSGIYEIKCLANKKVYIGSSIDIKRRWGEHRYQLKNNRHHSTRLQRSWNKYGQDNFEFNRIEEVDENILIEYEQKWMDLKQSFSREFGLNNRAFADTGEWMRDTRSKKYIITYPYGKEKNIENLTKFCRDNNLNQGTMSALSCYKLNHHKSYHCRRETDTYEQWKNKRQNYLNNRPPKKHPSKKRKSLWEIIFPDGEKEIIKSLTDFCKQHNLSQGNMTEVSYGNRLQHKGFKCINLDTV